MLVGKVIKIKQSLINLITKALVNFICKHLNSSGTKREAMGDRVLDNV